MDALIQREFDQQQWPHKWKAQLVRRRRLYIGALPDIRDIKSHPGDPRDPTAADRDAQDGRILWPDLGMALGPVRASRNTADGEWTRDEPAITGWRHWLTRRSAKLS
jgi:hypothetical protein